MVHKNGIRISGPYIWFVPQCWCPYRLKVGPHQHIKKSTNPSPLLLAAVPPFPAALVSVGGGVSSPCQRWRPASPLLACSLGGGSRLPSSPTPVRLALAWLLVAVQWFRWLPAVVLGGSGSRRLSLLEWWNPLEAATLPHWPSQISSQATQMGSVAASVADEHVACPFDE
jgi:hypothetical protein